MEWVNELAITLGHACGLAGLQVLLHLVLRQRMVLRAIFGQKMVSAMEKKPETSQKNLEVTAQDLVSSLVSIVLFFMYLKSSWDLRETAESRVRGHTELSYWAVQLHQGYTIYELLLYLYSGKDKLMYLHHLFVLANGLYTAWSRRLVFFYVWMGLVEGTNPCLSALYVLQRAERKDSSMMTICGVLLWLGFLLLRMVNVPLVFLGTVRDTPFVSDEDKIHLRFGQSSVLIIFFMSTFWFYKLTKGMLKQVGLIPRKNTTDKEGKEKRQ